jgi:hypothetical protein
MKYKIGEWYQLIKEREDWIPRAMPEIILTIGRKLCIYYDCEQRK